MHTQKSCADIKPRQSNKVVFRIISVWRRDRLWLYSYQCRLSLNNQRNSCATSASGLFNPTDEASCCTLESTPPLSFRQRDNDWQSVWVVIKTWKIGKHPFYSKSPKHIMQLNGFIIPQCEHQTPSVCLRLTAQMSPVIHSNRTVFTKFVL